MHNNEGDHFYSTKSSLPVIDPKLGLLQIKLGDEIDTKGDLIASNRDILLQLRLHYQSILDQLRFTLINVHEDDNTWMMAMMDTTSAPQDRREQTPRMTHDTATSLIRDLQYLQQGQFERIRRSLAVARGQLVETYMRWWIQSTGQMFNLQGNTGIMSEDVEEEALAGEESAGGKRNAIYGWPEPQQESLESNQEPESGDAETGIIEHIHHMEMMLVKEAEFWEEQLSSRMQKFVGSGDVLEKEQLQIQMEWKANCRQQFNSDVQAMDARLDAVKLAVRMNGSDKLIRKWQSAHNCIKSAWQSVLERFIENLTPPSSSTSLSHLDHLWIDFQQNA
jgi:hypothetical protein